METSSSSTFDSAIAIDTYELPPKSPRCNEQARSLNLKLSTALASPEVVARKKIDGTICDSEKLKVELLLKADEFFNAGCIKIEQLKNEARIEQLLLRQSEELTAFSQKEDMEVDVEEKKCVEKGVSINIDGEFEVLLEHIEGLNTPEIANDMLGVKLCSNFDSSSKAIVVSSLETLGKILNMPAFDPHAPPVKFKIKQALSLRELSNREDNAILIDIPMESVDTYMESKEFNPFNQYLNLFINHEKEEFSTFCSCKECLSYREVVVHMMMEQFKASHMVVLLLEALLKAYSPLLKNTSAINHFEKLFEINKDIHWLASGLIYNKKYEEFDFIYDETLTDPTILVLFSSILMINSPMQLLQVLEFYISCIVEAFAFGIAEVSIEEKLIYILDGFDHLCDISDQIASYFVIFERNFLSKFSLTWLWLCQRIFHRQVYVRFFVAITNCGEVLKKEDPLKLRFSEFVKRMLYLDVCWAKIIWPKLQKFNLTESEYKRRNSMVIIHKLFESLVEDAIRMPICDGNKEEDDNYFEDILELKDRRVLWKNILSFAKMQWADGFFSEPNVLVYDIRCEKCGSVCMQHESGCKCITCNIGGIALFQNRDNLCTDCGEQDNGDANANDENVNDETESASAVSEDENFTEAEHNSIKICRQELKKMITNNISNVIQSDFCEIQPADVYHISWAVFKHFTQRKLYARDKIDEKYFCKDCKFPACILARRLLNNEMAPALTKILMSNFNPLPMLQSDLHGIFPVVFYLNPRMFASHHESSLHNSVVKAYWTFIISVFGTYFIGVEKPCPLNLDALEIDQSDVRVVAEKLKGNIDDGIFLEFLDTIRSSSSVSDGGYIAPTQSLDQDFIGRKKLEFLKPTRKSFNNKNVLRISTDSIKMPSTAIDNGDINAVTVQPTSINCLPQLVGGCGESMDQKRGCAQKSKKCCLEHAAEFGPDHCKDNHANRKRLKKDCSHARVNETRDRLRKKLQDVRKSQQQLQTHQIQQQAQSINQPQQQQQHQQPNIKLPQKMHHANDSSEISSVDEPTIKHVVTNLTRKLPPPMSPTTTTPVTGTNTPQSVENVDDDSDQVIGKVMEICDMLDNNKQKMKKWLDETLTYIEGYASSTPPTSASTNAKRTQPQPKDPKKAAKKLKQKLRKEEEKRIAELHEIRGQFQDIYFKEFLEKIELKTLKKGGGGGSGVGGGGGNSNGNINSKRRCDKKKIADVEANIKKLQRAKSKLESNILELIATVKQTNTEFKFPYLPTKEQQQAKLQELAENTNNDEETAHSTPSTDQSAAVAQHDEVATPGSNYMPPFPKFYPNISFPYEMSFPVGNGTPAPPPPPPYGMVSHHALPTGCYAPLQQQALSPNVIAALTANEKSVSNSNTDPSKRIVTIRRVHNPDMPDSQVTVTARGGTHGKEKLLYTFVNGTMVPTTTTGAVNPNDFQQGSHHSHQSQHQPVPGDSQQLSKSQLKKERRRAAKLLSLEQDLAISDCDEDDASTAVASNPTLTQSKKRTANNTKDMKVKKQKVLTKGLSEDSTTSSNQSFKKGAHEKTSMTQPKGTKLNGKASSSSISVETVSDATVTATKNKNKNAQKQKQKETEIKTNLKSLKKREQQRKRRESNADSYESITLAVVVQRTDSSQTTKSQPKITHGQENAQKSNKNCSTIEQPVVTTSLKIKTKENKQKQRRLKLINHGQFDNNPYKNLHMQDSDSELDVTASSCDEEEGLEEQESVSSAKTTAELETIQEPPKKARSKSTKTKATETQTDVKVEKISSTSAPAPNRSKSTQTPSTARAEADTKTLKTQNQHHQQQQQTKKDSATNTIKRQTEQQKGKQTTKNAQNTHNERRYTDSIASINSKQTMLSQNATTQQRRNNKRQDAATSTSNNKNPPPIKANTRENERSKTAATAAATKDHILNDEKSTTSSSSKRAQRARKKQQQSLQQIQHYVSHQNHAYVNNYSDCGAGIPMRMEYFNPNEVNFPSSQQLPTTKASASTSIYQQPLHYENLTRQFQNMRVAPTSTKSAVNMLSSYSNISTTTASNVSIMDQLNRGVQVENLSLPPGITLTKVDPIKSEQLRLKSESIKRLSQPLQAQPHNSIGVAPYSHHPHHGSTIIAPPTSNYMTNSVAPGGGGGGNIIMVEGITSKPPAPSSAAIAAAAAAATASGKASSKSKRRRNKGKKNDCSPRDSVSTNASSNNDQQQTKMITLRNPMFHAGPAAAAASILQQPTLLAGHHGYAGSSNSGLSMATPLQDQPAAIIKNENGMFTIRNPALHQAVTNGLALGGYRQFGGNVSYYTPQEAVAEAAKAQQQQQQMKENSQRQPNLALPTESFSYFSNNNTAKTLPKTTNELVAQPTTKTISITCTTVDSSHSNLNSESDNASQRIENPTPSPIARPPSAQRCISAIGSEVKQNRNSANMDHLWSEYRQPQQLQQSHEMSQSNENLLNVSATLLGNSVVSDGSNSNQQSDYFNGYEVFPQRNCGGNSHITQHAAHSTPAPKVAVSSIARPNLTAPSSALSRSPNPLFETSVNNDSCQMGTHSHHRCGDDSPPPTSLLSYSSTYLDDIPNTGVIRYDDASFLKNLIPGQRLNKEVSIHNINESNFGRPTSPMSHLIEITPVYSVGGGSVNSKKMVSPSSQQVQQTYLRAPSSSSVPAAGAYSTNSMSNYQQNYNDYDQSAAFPSSGSNDNTTASSTGSAEQSYQPFGYDAFDASATTATVSSLLTDQKNINSLFPTNFTTTSQRSSPYLDESFVQNLNALQISGPGPGPEQCSQQQLNGEARLGNVNNCNPATSSTSASGWW